MALYANGISIVMAGLVPAIHVTSALHCQNGKKA